MNLHEFQSEKPIVTTESRAKNKVGKFCPCDTFARAEIRRRPCLKSTYGDLDCARVERLHFSQHSFGQTVCASDGEKKTRDALCA